MKRDKILNKIKLRKKIRVRAKLFGTGQRPRFSVFVSNRFIYAQLIDDEIGKTIASASTKELIDEKSLPAGRQELPMMLGELIAKKAIEKGIKTIIFDRGGYKYHGRVKAIAESARKNGLEF
ncbi:MAG: 50S ribosomal protein L18 [Patescibacteria group bacterium]